MTQLELREIALNFVDKGYADHGMLRDSDDLYSASAEDKDMCCEFLSEIVDYGSKKQREIIEKLKTTKNDNIIHD